MKISRNTVYVIAAVVLVIITGGGAYFASSVLPMIQLMNSTQPTETIDIAFNTAPTIRPAGRDCLRPEGTVAKEIMNAETGVVYVAGGANPISDEAWESFSLDLPFLKNSTRHLLFTESCFFASPGVPQGCEGEDCYVRETLFDHTWLKLSDVETLQCIPNPTEGCSLTTVEPGHLAVRVMLKCHEITFRDTAFVLTSPEGDTYLMHATATGTPDVNVALPEGWTLDAQSLDMPIVLNPAGGDEDCYYNIIRDAAEQAYHSYTFVNAVYP